jgi:hypothetical protein
MEFILIHTPNSNLTRESMPVVLEMAKTVVTTPEKFVPGGKLIASYAARARIFIVCIWDVPSADALMPALEQMNLLGYDTEVIPAEKLGVKMDKLVKAMAAMK